MNGGEFSKSVRGPPASKLWRRNKITNGRIREDFVSVANAMYYAIAARSRLSRYLNRSLVEKKIFYSIGTRKIVLVMNEIFNLGDDGIETKISMVDIEDKLQPSRKTGNGLT
jgi:hypothetical protein